MIALSATVKEWASAGRVEGTFYYRKHGSAGIVHTAHDFIFSSSAARAVPVVAEP